MESNNGTNAPVEQEAEQNVSAAIITDQEGNRSDVSNNEPKAVITRQVEGDNAPEVGDAADAEADDTDEADGEGDEKEKPNSSLDLESALKEVSKLRKESAKYRVEARTLREKIEKEQKEAERAKMDEVQRLQSEREEFEKLYLDAKTNNEKLETQYALQGKVANPKSAILLLDKSKHYSEDGELNLESFFEDYPEQQPIAKSGSGQQSSKPEMVDAPKVPSGRTVRPKSLSREAIMNMSDEEYQSRREEIYQAYRDGRLN